MSYNNAAWSSRIDPNLAIRCPELSSRSKCEADSTAPIRLRIADVLLYESNDEGENRAAGGSSTFARSKARWIWYRVNLRHGFRTSTYRQKLTVSCYKPDSSEVSSGTIEHDIDVRPEEPEVSVRGGWGFKDAGSWQAGDYRLEFQLDRAAKKSVEFTVLDDAPVENLLDLAHNPLNHAPQTKPFPLGPGKPVLSVNGPMQQTSGRGAVSTGTLPAVPHDDVGKMLRLMQIDRRALSIIPHTRKPNASVLENLKGTVADYEAVLAAGIPSRWLYTTESLRSKIADTRASAARVAYELGGREEASRLFRETAGDYRAAGKNDKAEQCEADFERLSNPDDSSVDRQMQPRPRKIKAGEKRQSGKDATFQPT